MENCKYERFSFHSGLGICGIQAIPVLPGFRNGPEHIYGRSQLCQLLGVWSEPNIRSSNREVDKIALAEHKYIYSNRTSTTITTASPSFEAFVTSPLLRSPTPRALVHDTREPLTRGSTANTTTAITRSYYGNSLYPTYSQS